jgi:hypothetical protein
MSGEYGVDVSVAYALSALLGERRWQGRVQQHVGLGKGEARIGQKRV